MARDPLAAIIAAAERATLARENLEQAIQAAHPPYSLRQIAEVAGMSHEQVRRIVKRGDPR